MLRCYVIAAYSHAPAVRAIHDRLRMMGIEPVSSWAEEATGPECLDGLSDDECYEIWRRNNADLRSSDVALVLADTPMREGFQELERALRDGWPTQVVYVGRPTLTMRTGASWSHVWFCESVDDALAGLEGMVPRG